MTELRPGQVVGEWTLLELIGEGGNASVWRASGPSGHAVALKVLKTVRPASEPYRRFRREIATLQRLGGREGVLPILASSLPANPTRADPAWIAMPLATRLADALRGRSLVEIVAACEAIARSLAELHAEGIAHRDVKPANLYSFQDRPVVGDFGLVDLPDQSELTDPDKPLGPRNFIPYEFIANPAQALGPPADVFMFAKTLWVLATDQRWPPQGEQRADNEALSIAGYQTHPRARLLDGLVERATRHVPAQRPTMSEVADDLAAWLANPPGVQGPALGVAVARLRQATAQGLSAAAGRAHMEELLVDHLARLSRAVQPVEDELAGQFPVTTQDGFEQLARDVLGYRLYLGTVGLIAEEVRATRLDEPTDFFPVSLIVGRSLALTEDGVLHVDGLCFLGRTDINGDAEFLWRFGPNAVPIDSIRASVEVDRLAAAIVEGIPTWVNGFAKRLEIDPKRGP